MTGQPLQLPQGLILGLLTKFGRPGGLFTTSPPSAALRSGLSVAIPAANSPIIVYVPDILLFREDPNLGRANMAFCIIPKSSFF